MNNILYSIIVPIYGVENYLYQCINSLISQTYKNIEIILVDDGSKDCSPSICDDFAKKDKRIIVIHKLNGGLVSARKAGAKIAKGDYIFCIDGDDWIPIDYIEKFNVHIIKYSPDMVCCGHIIDNNSQYTPSPIGIPSGFYSKEKLKNEIYDIAIMDKRGNMFPHNLWSKAIKRSLYINEQMAVNDKIKIGEDAAVIKPLLTKCNSLYVMDDCLYFYRYNPSSMTKNKVFDLSFPSLLFEHLKRCINTDSFDFHSQVKRWICKELYTAIISQFNSDESFFSIRKKILLVLNDDIYKEILHNTRFEDKKNRIQCFLLKNKYILFLYLISKL